MPYEVQVTVEFKRSEFVQGGLGESQAGASFFNSHNFNSNIAWVCIYFSISGNVCIIILCDLPEFGKL